MSKAKTAEETPFEKNLNHEDRLTELDNKYKRALADYQNLARQAAADKVAFAKYANTALILELLPVYDHLQLSLVYADGADRWLAGVRHVAEQFKKVLAEAGVEPIDAAGRVFNHDVMDAVETVDTDDAEQDGLVAKELKAGYRLFDKVIRPAQVAVFKVKTTN